MDPHGITRTGHVCRRGRRHTGALRRDHDPAPRRRALAVVLELPARHTGELALDREALTAARPADYGVILGQAVEHANLPESERETVRGHLINLDGHALASPGLPRPGVDYRLQTLAEFMFNLATSAKQRAVPIQLP